jgi:hypothetical protein
VPTSYKVKGGDCIASIAFRYGLFPETVWEHSENAALRELRKNPAQLVPGDVVVIPDKVAKEVEGTTEQRHRFRRKGVPEELRMQLMENGKPLANVDYALELGGEIVDGKTDDDGYLEQNIAPDAKVGQLFVHYQDSHGVMQTAEYDLEVGELEPIDLRDGVVARLINLGFLEPEDPEDVDDDELADAVTDFQRYLGLEITGTVNDEVRNRLVEMHGC